MNTQDQKLRVAPTSAMVLSFVKELYADGLTREYMQHIDLSSVQGIIDMITHITRHFGELALFRKKMIRYLVKQFIGRYPKHQVCILAAGLDPLGLYLADTYPHAIGHIYEVDQAWMPEKSGIYAKVAGHLGLPLHTLQADVTHTLELRRALQEAGYDSSLPTLVVFEGIIHYITEEHFLDIMQCFSTRNRRNTVMLDYSLVTEEISPAFLQVATDLLAFMKDTLKVVFHQYSRRKMQNMLALLEAEIYNTYDMQAAEYLMNGENRLYHQPGDGILEMVAFHL